MTSRILMAGMLVLMASCVRETRPLRSQAPFPARVPTMWERQIRNAIDAGDGDYRIRALRDRVASEPENIAVRLELAKAYGDSGYPDLALEMCRLAAARFPESGEVRLALVRALRGMGRRQEAIEDLEAFLKSHPQISPDHFSWLGILRDEAGMWPAGEPAHRRAVELAPSMDTLHNNLGYNLLMQNKPAEAAAEFREALRLNPQSQIARNNLGTALAHQNAGAQAVANWQSALDPATAHNNLAAVMIEKGNYAEARKELETALGYNRSHPVALRNLELVSRLEGQPANLLYDLPQPTRWDRWKSGFKRLFVGPLDEPASRAPKSTAAAR